MIVYQFQQASIEHPERCEDVLLVAPHTTEDGQPDGKAPTFAIIDGMGGHKHQLADGRLLTGQDAAQLICETVRADLDSLPADANLDPGGEIEQKIVAALVHAHQRVFKELNGEELPLRERIGAVMTLVLVGENGKRLLAAQIGDSRAYVFSEGDLIQLCLDEDNIEYLVRHHGLSQHDAKRIADILNSYDGVNEPQVEGTIKLGGQEYELYMAWRWFLNGNQALNIPAANVVINSVGTQQTDPTSEKSRFELTPGDLLVLCSDGLYKNLSEAEIITGLQDPTDPAKALGEAALARSQDKSNHRQDPDDISVVVVRF